MNKSHSYQKALCVGALWGISALTLSAATQTWNGSTDTNYNETANWSGNDVPDNNDSGILDGGGTGITDLSGGVTPDIASALNIRGGHVLNIDNDGGVLTVINNVNMGRGATGDGSTINHSAGAFNIGGLDMSGNATGGSSFYNLSGTAALSIGPNGGTRTFNIGGDTGVGDFPTTFTISGDAATVMVNARPVQLRSSAIIEFSLGATGVDAIDTTGNLELQAGASLTVDGSSYTGGAGTIPLFSCGSRTDATEFTTENISGFTGFDTQVIYSDFGIDLAILTPGGGPVVTSLTADTTSVLSGNPVTLSWATLNATTLTLNPGNIDVSSVTNFLVNPTDTTTYTLVASDGSTTDSETIVIEVTPEIVFFDAGAGTVSPLSILSGDDVTLEWQVDDFTNLTLNPGGINVTNNNPAAFTISPGPTTTTVYTLVAARGSSTVEAEFTIAVEPTINSFTSTPSRVTSGSDSTLNWEVSNASILTLDPGGIDVSGQTSQLVTNITANTTYTLTASDGTNSVSEDFTVILLDSPSPTIVGSPVISVNFHVADADAPADHELTSGETAGYIPVDGAFWTNINLGAPATHVVESLFPSTPLIDDTGNASAAAIAPSVDSSYFVGYAASAASEAFELGLAGNDDDLFNSYLAMNGPSGDGSPADAATLNVSGLGAAYTSGGYTVIIYSDSDRRNTGTNTRQSLFTLTQGGGSARSAFVEDDDSELGVNIFDGLYVFSDGVDDGPDYSNVTIIEGLSADSFTLEITSPSNGGRGAISGFQIVGGTGIISTDDLLLCIENAANGSDLDFSWNSLPGMSYNLRASNSLNSDPATWPIVQGNILATSPSNALSLTRPGDTKTFYVIEELATPTP